MSDWYDRDREPAEPEPEAQPDDFCECRPGLELRHRWQHDTACRRWAPALQGPGSTPAGRAAARRLYEAQRAAARQTTAKAPQPPQEARASPGACAEVPPRGPGTAHDG
jgi:hypothetical protein